MTKISFSYTDLLLKYILHSFQLGGNPLACAIGNSVLEVIKNEKLVSSAKMVGKVLLEGLTLLMEKYNYIGYVRGRGLCIGVEIVCGRPNLKPANNLASRLLYK